MNRSTENLSALLGVLAGSGMELAAMTLPPAPVYYPPRDPNRPDPQRQSAAQAKRVRKQARRLAQTTNPKDTTHEL